MTAAKILPCCTAHCKLHCCADAQSVHPPELWTALQYERKAKELLLVPCSARQLPIVGTAPTSALQTACLAVSRYKCKSDLYGADLILDVNSDIYPLDLGGRYTMKITQTLVADVSAQKEEYDPVQPCALHCAHCTHCHSSCTGTGARAGSSAKGHHCMQAGCHRRTHVDAHRHVCT